MTTTRKEEILSVARQKGEPITRDDVVTKTDMSSTRAGNLLSEMAGDELVRVKRGHYGLPEDYAVKNEQRAVDKKRATAHTSTMRSDAILVGGGETSMARDEIVYDERIFQSTGIELGNGKQFAKVRGDSMAPYVNDGQLVVVEPQREVTVDGLYVYFFHKEDGLLVAHFERIAGGILLTKKGPNPRSVKYYYKEGTTYENEGGRAVDIKIQGRVLGNFSRPSVHMSEAEEAARHGSVG